MRDKWIFMCDLYFLLYLAYSNDAMSKKNKIFNCVLQLTFLRIHTCFGINWLAHFDLFLCHLFVCLFVFIAFLFVCSSFRYCFENLFEFQMKLNLCLTFCAKQTNTFVYSTVQHIHCYFCFFFAQFPAHKRNQQQLRTLILFRHFYFRQNFKFVSIIAIYNEFYLYGIDINVNTKMISVCVCVRVCSSIYQMPTYSFVECMFVSIQFKVSYDMCRFSDVCKRTQR